MIRRRIKPSGEPKLIRLAVGDAEHAMRTIGRIPPTLLAETDEGLLLYLPEQMGDERAKQNFAVGYRASAAAFVLESWATFAKPGKPLAKDTPPSQLPDREEAVVISVEPPTRGFRRFS